MRIPTKTERNLAIVARFENGESGKALARAYGIGLHRVYHLIKIWRNPKPVEPLLPKATPKAAAARRMRTAEAALAREIRLAKQEAAAAPLFRPSIAEIDRFLGSGRPDNV